MANAPLARGPLSNQSGEYRMSKKVIVFGAASALAILVGGWAFAQVSSGEPEGFGPMRMMGMRRHMGTGVHRMMGGPMSAHAMRNSGMMGMGHRSATPTEHSDIRDLFLNHDRIKRSVINLPDGIRTLTESDDPQLAKVIKDHVATMGSRVQEGRDPGLPIETDALHSIFRDKDKIKSTYEVTEKGMAVVQTSTDPKVVRELQEHAAQVSDLAARGMAAAHEATMGNMAHGGGDRGGHTMRGQR